MTTARDGCVVPTEPLAHALGGFMRERNRLVGSGTGRFGHRAAPAKQEAPVPLVGAYEWLEAETRLHDPDGRGVSRKTIKRIVGGQTTITDYRIADMLVAAIGRPELFHDGTLEVFENPHASRDSPRDICCGRQLPGRP